MGIKISRWQRAQEAECTAWETSTQTQPLTSEVRTENLNLMSQYTSLSGEELRCRRILEIGGAVVERAFDETSISPKLVLDPLLPFDRLVGQLDKSCHRVRGMGEHLPLPDKSVDLCWCANTIDHTLSPKAVLQEIRRVLDDKGTLVISCHLFPAWTKPFLPMFDILDKPHPYHFTTVHFRTLLKQNFDVQKEFEVRIVAQNIKTNIASHLGVRYIYFTCMPVRK